MEISVRHPQKFIQCVWMLNISFITDIVTYGLVQAGYLTPYGVAVP